MANTKPLRIIFAGTPDFAASHLQALLDHKEHEIIAVYSQPDRPAGRGKKLRPSPVKAVALENSIPVFQPVSLKDEAAQQEFAALNADLMVVVAYGLLLPHAILDTPRLGCINVHASILPRWRGAAPIQRAIEAGDQETGVTIMQMDIGLDTGDMLEKAYCQITEQDTSGTLHDKLIEVGQPALISTIKALANGTASPEKQDDSLSNYAKKIDKSELAIDWQQDAKSIALKIRAFNPFPICYTLLNGERLKLWQAKEVSTDKQKKAGEIIAADSKGITIACGNNAISLTQLQLPGGKALMVDAVMNARAEQFKVGTVLGQ